MALGEHLFTLSLSGELSVRDLQLEHDLPDRPEGWRLALQMKVSRLSLAMQSLHGRSNVWGMGPPYRQEVNEFVSESVSQTEQVCLTQVTTTAAE